MANYTQLIRIINDNIKANGNQEITGPVLNAVLQAIVMELSKGSLFVGIATTATNPGTPDGNVFYLAIEPGTYSNFGVIVPNGSIGIIHNTSSDWEVILINTYYEIDVDTLMQDSPSSDDIYEAIGSFSDLRRAITVGVPFFGRGASGGNSTVAIAQVKQLTDNEVRVVMLNTGTVDGSNELVPIIKKITNSAGRLSLSTEAPTSFVGPLSSLNTNDKGSVVEAINEVNTGLKSAVKPYVVNLTNLLAAQDSQSISTAIGGIDNLNGTVQKNQVIFGTLANGTVAVGIRVLGNKTTLTYFVDSVVGLTVNEVIITNTSGTLTKTANTHAVLTENMVINNLESDENTLPLSAAQGKVLATNKQGKTDKSLQTTDKTVTGAINEVNQAVKTKQDKLKPGTGVEITSDNTVNVTLDTTVFKVVASLPESPAAGDENKIHLVPAESTEEGNIYTEYVFVNGKWEKFGTYRSEVDLTQYLKSTEAEATYQKITDNTLTTTSKLVPGAINEMNGLLKEGYLFKGIATPNTNPGTPDGNVFYIAVEPGTYSNFGVTVLSGAIAVLSNTDSGWEVSYINAHSTIYADILQLYLLEMQERDSYLDHTADISYKDGYFIYKKDGTESASATISIATVRNISKYRALIIENFLTASVKDSLGILFYDDNDNIISYFSAEAQDLNNFEGLIPENTSYIKFNVRTAYKDRVAVKTDNLDQSDGFRVKIEEVDGLSDRLDELSEGKISSIKDILATSSNLMNPDEVHLNQYDNGNFPHDSTSYNYAEIGVSDYPVGTKFYLMHKPHNKKVSMRYAGFYPTPDKAHFAENQLVIEKTEETQELLSVSFSSYYNISELGVFVNVEDSDDFVFEDYYSEVQAEAQWKRDAKNDNILVKKKELDTLRNEFSGNNILSGKKWAVIGDSFSADGTFSDIEDSQKIQDGPMKGKVPTYKNLIANRNNMTIQDMTAGGRTMATPADGSFTNAFSNEDNVAADSNYKQIDSDVDYITIYLGINDSHHAGHGDDGEETQGEIPVGTIDDATVNTFYGAWNVVLKYIRENHPFAKVGIIVSNGCGVDTYRQAEIELCKKWGFPYIDMNGDERTPAMIRSTSSDVSQEAKNVILEKQKISETNQHPNLQAQAFESTFIENFLRSL